MFLTFNFSTISKKKRYSRTGHRILEDPSKEYERNHLGTCCSLSEIQEKWLFSIIFHFFFLIPTKKSFGQGTRLFFSFLRFLTLLDLVLGGIGLISWGRYIYTTGQQSHSWVANDLFVSCYPSDLRNLWAVSCYIALGLWFGIP